ncbi:MAG: radical SAM protein [Planctomycetes bacterium]|nr:radical SAM protein [Planctomycetota bacterium]
MYFRMARRLLFETNKRLLWKLAWNAGFRGIQSIRRHQKRLKRGEFYPPFLYVSVTNSCNLRCQGCWVDVAAQQAKIEAPAMHRLINESREMGNTFFGIVGGEPFLHPELLDILAEHPDCYFQIFTNGHFVTPAVARRMFQLGNISPLVSVEGNEIVSDERRGHSDVYRRTMDGLRNCLDARLLTGVCTSLCQTNMDLLTEQWLDKLIAMRVFYAWFHIYRPVGANASPELCLTPDQQKQARRFVVEMRSRKPIIIVDAYYDSDGYALCPAVTGFTHHVSPWGDIEPCPVIQIAKDSIHDQRPLREVLGESAFLRDFRETAATWTRGCILLERPDLLVELAHRHGARDSTARQTVLEELESMKSRASQFNPGNELAEKNWIYRIFKRLWFNDYGAYAKYFRRDQWHDPRSPKDAT